MCLCQLPAYDWWFSLWKHAPFSDKSGHVHLDIEILLIKPQSVDRSEQLYLVPKANVTTKTLEYNKLIKHYSTFFPERDSFSSFALDTVRKIFG